jgi:mono/diheme cytochrome c family protein
MFRKISRLTIIHFFLLLILAACAPKEVETPAEAGEAVARPSNPGGPGEAVNLTGEATAGKEIYLTYCQVCHGPEGKGGVANPGTDDETVPELNPIDSTLLSPDSRTSITNLDLFMEHGSTPAGKDPTLVMPAWGDNQTLQPQQIVDVIAYIISLNK